MRASAKISMKNRQRMRLLCGKDRNCKQTFPLTVIGPVCIIEMDYYMEGTMREYNEKKQLISMQCNCCKKLLQTENEIVTEGCFSVDYIWGYFSTRTALVINLICVRTVMTGL